MRTCPACKATYSDDATVCAADGTSLVVELELGDTIQQSRSAVLAAVAAPSTTPGPVVRSRGSGSGSGSGSGHGHGAGKGSATPAFDSVVGTTLAERYEVTRKVGEGGMGAVYEGRHLKIGKRVAIKILLDKYIEKADVVARLQQEARLASSIGHENIVDITDFGETDDGRTFVVMEFLEGEALASVIEREGALPPARAVAIARQVASALGAAHGKAIVHRDVKPENVFIVRRGDKDFVKVVDFGISKAMRPPGESDEGGPGASPRLTQTGMVLGTPLYMSPEQARGEDDLDHRIDVYALGTILYEMLTGEVPFHGSNYLNIISQVLSQEPPAPSKVRPDLGISPALEAIVAKAMSKDRHIRYQTMAELDADLAKVEAGVAVRPTTVTHARRRFTTLVAWAGAVAAVVVGVALVLPRILKSDEPKLEPPPPPPAEVKSSPTTPAASSAPGVQQPEVKTIKAHVTSKPTGAEVWMGSVKMGTTPLDMDVPYAAKEVALTLRLDGWDDAPAIFWPNKDQDVPVTFTKRKATDPGKGNGKKPGGKPGASAATSSGTPDDGEIHKNPYGNGSGSK